MFNKRAESGVDGKAGGHSNWDHGESNKYCKMCASSVISQAPYYHIFSYFIICSVNNDPLK